MRKLFLLATPWLMFTWSAAADIVYEVNETVDGGSVMGTITTDGTDGPLSTIDIVSYELNLSDGTDTGTLSGPSIDPTMGSSVFISSGALVANPDGTLDFSGADGAFVNFFSNPSDTACAPIWTLRVDGGSTCANVDTANPNPVLPIDGNVNAIAVTDANIASVPLTAGESIQIAVVPEPGTIGLVLAGLVSLIGFRKLRF